jgi:hypothetical protein
MEMKYFASVMVNQIVETSFVLDMNFYLEVRDKMMIKIKKIGIQLEMGIEGLEKKSLEYGDKCKTYNDFGESELLSSKMLTWVYE